MSGIRDLPGHYLIAAARTLGGCGPKATPQTVLIDALPFWGRFRVTFAPARADSGAWQWTVAEQIRLEAPTRPYLAGLVEVFGRAHQ